MNPSQIAAQADRIGALCNLAARIGNGEPLFGGVASDGGAHAIAANGTGVNLDIDITYVEWNRFGVPHNSTDNQTDFFSAPNATVVQADGQSPGTANFPTATPAATAAEEITLAVIFGSDGNNASPAFQGVCSSVWAAPGASASPTDAEITTAHGSDNWTKLGVVVITRTLADNTVLTCDYDLSNRIDQHTYQLLDLTKV